jgi:hypothetical protein
MIKKNSLRSETGQRASDMIQKNSLRSETGQRACDMIQKNSLRSEIGQRACDMTLKIGQDHMSVTVHQHAVNMMNMQGDAAALLRTQIGIALMQVEGRADAAVLCHVETAMIRMEMKGQEDTDVAALFHMMKGGDVAALVWRIRSLAVKGQRVKGQKTDVLALRLGGPWPLQGTVATSTPTAHHQGGQGPWQLQPQAVATTILLDMAPGLHIDTQCTKGRHEDMKKT